MAKLTARQEAFVREYLVDFNAAAAMRRAGYSEQTARHTGWKVVRHPAVRDAVQEGCRRLSEEAGRRALDVLRDIQDVAREAREGGDLRTCLRGLELEGKHYGMFTDRVRQEISGPGGGPVPAEIVVSFVGAEEGSALGAEEGSALGAEGVAGTGAYEGEDEGFPTSTEAGGAEGVEEEGGEGADGVPAGLEGAAEGAGEDGRAGRDSPRRGGGAEGVTESRSQRTESLSQRTDRRSDRMISGSERTPLELHPSAGGMPAAFASSAVSASPAIPAASASSTATGGGASHGGASHG